MPRSAARAARLLLWPLALVPLLGACAGGDDTAPELVVTSPVRGSIADGTTVTVTGQVRDDGGTVRVTVAGVEAPVAADGSFAATVEVGAGIDVIETLATDAAGNQTRDVRAVLAGELVPVATPVGDALAARVGPAALHTVGEIVGDTVDGMDLAATARALNPIYSTGGSCLGVDVSFLDLQKSDVAVSLAPVPGALATGVRIDDVVIDLRADYKLACLGGSSHVTVRADQVRVTGDLGLGVTGGDLHAAIAGLSVQIDNLDVDASGVPDAVFDLFSGTIERKVEEAIEGAIADAVPGLVEATLADLTSRAFVVPALGRDVSVQVRPTTVTIDAGGAFVALDGTLGVAGGDGAVYLASPARASAGMMGADGGFGVALADDTLNQAFAGMWASGALDLGVDLERGHPLQLVLGDRARRVDVAMALPPTVTVGPEGGLRVMIGDAILHLRDADGVEVATIALSLATTLDAEPGDRIRLALGAPEVFAQVLTQAADQPPFTGPQLEDLVGTLFGLMGPMIDDVIGAVPMPTIAGATVANPGVSSRDGFVVVRGDLAAAP